MPAARPDFGALAAGYDRLRPADANWWQVFEALAAELEPAGRRVLDVGCGTGRVAHALAERGAEVWAVDASDEMLAVARARDLPGGGYERARAERLPFEAGTFDAVVFRQSIHLVDRAAALGEAARVLRPGARVVVATFHPAHFERVWIARLFPRVAELDRKRFPDAHRLTAELSAAGFGAPRTRRLTQDAPVTREEALERIRGGYISTLHLLAPAEVAEGLERAERELPERVPSTLDWLLVAADRVGPTPPRRMSSDAASSFRLVL